MKERLEKYSEGLRHYNEIFVTRNVAKPSVSSEQEFVPINEKCHILKLNNHLAFRIYPNSRPKNLETAELQKGLILTLFGKELVEEGVGFGVPVAMFSDKTYFSKSAQVFVRDGEQGTVLSKRFQMDAVSKKQWKEKFFIENRPYSFFSHLVANAYRNHMLVQKMMQPIIRLEKSIGIQTRFVKVKPRGEVVVTYWINSNRIHVNVDLTRLQKHGCDKVFVLNEQGATFFRKYFDSSGLELTDESIGAWEEVKARWASISDLKETLGFRLRKASDFKMYRGREYVEGRLTWAGLTYELNPDIQLFPYEIEIRTRGQKENV